MSSADALLVNGDIRYDGAGKLVVTTDTDKLRQELLKITLTNIGENLYDRNYGTTIREMIGSAFPPSVAKALITSAIDKAQSYYQSLQKESQQLRTLSKAEFVASVKSITAEPLADDPREWYVVVEVVTGDLTALRIDTTVQVQ